MGTRCLINFSKDLESVKEGITIYKHWDGYPSNVLEILMDFYNNGKPRRSEIDYLSAGFLRYIQLIEMDSVFRHEPFLSYGIIGNVDLLSDDSDLMGADYVYIVTPDTIHIFNYDMDLIKTVDLNKLIKETYRYYQEIMDSMK